MNRIVALLLSITACGTLLLGGCGGGTSETVEPQDGVVVFLAAASTAEAVEAIARNFREETGIEVAISTAGSNTLANQIIAGAPADVFLSASQEWADAVADKELVGKMQPLLTNRLVLVVPRGNPDNVKGPDDLRSPRLTKLALAGENVPAGKYADQALRSLGLLEDLTQRKKIARGQDVRGALTYVELGEVSAGIVYATDAKISQRVEVVYTFPANTHDEVVYPAVLLRRGAENDAARRFFEYLCGTKAGEVFQRKGFEPAKQIQAR
jgi:molybdate transport system substrate-binding protein